MRRDTLFLQWTECLLSKIKLKNKNNLKKKKKPKLHVRLWVQLSTAISVWVVMQKRNLGYSLYTACIQNCPFEGEAPPTVLLIFLAWFSNLLFQWDPSNLRFFRDLFLAANKLLAWDVCVKPFPLWSYPASAVGFLQPTIWKEPVGGCLSTVNPRHPPFPLLSRTCAAGSGGYCRSWVCLRAAYSNTGAWGCTVPRGSYRGRRGCCHLSHSK